MTPDVLIATGSLFTIVAGVYVTIRKSNSETKATAITGEQNRSKIDEDYISRMEVRMKKLETDRDASDDRLANMRASFSAMIEDNLNLQKEFNILKSELEDVKLENKRLVLDNSLKIGRISILENQIKDLQRQLDDYKHIDTAKVDDAKATLISQVEDAKATLLVQVDEGLEGIKQ